MKKSEGLWVRSFIDTIRADGTEEGGGGTIVFLQILAKLEAYSVASKDLVLLIAQSYFHTFRQLYK